MSESASSSRHRSRSRSRSRTRDQPQPSNREPVAASAAVVPPAAAAVNAAEQVLALTATVQQQAQQLARMERTILQLQLETSNLHHRAIVDRHNLSVSRVNSNRGGAGLNMLLKRIFVPARLVAGPDGQQQLQPATSDFPAHFPPEGVVVESLTEEQLLDIWNAYGLEVPEQPCEISKEFSKEFSQGALSYFLQWTSLQLEK